MNIVIGPPGTGKTSTLLGLVEENLEKGVDPTDIGYFAFTNRAADEAKERAFERFHFGNDNLPFFRTLHSLAFQQLGLSRSQVFNEDQRKEFGNLMGLEITGRSSFEEGSFAFSKKGDQILSIIEVARVRGITARQQWHKESLDISWFEIERAERGLAEFKKIRNLYDFTDMLSLFISEDVAPKLEIIFIDEAQDLSFLQWQLVFELRKLCNRMYIAGDDDQAIFRWAGADVNNFLTLKGEIQVLDQSYRVPQHAHYLAETLIKRVSKRRNKFWKPRPAEGRLLWHSDIEHIDMSQGEWLVLARNNYLLNSVENQCRLEGFFYKRSNRKGVSDSLLEAILDWEKLRKGESISAMQVRKIYRYMTSDRGVARSYKTLKSTFDEERLTLQDLLASYGLLTTAIWHEAFDKISDKEKQYLIACLRRGEKLTKTPRIHISTIHGAKGSEADNVVVLTDIGQKSWLQMQKEPDEEIRVFYVALTRVKQNLHIVQPATSRSFLI
jgi:DNA helicase-2/ATP-dependent DNA helicase PcrA